MGQQNAKELAEPVTVKDAADMSNSTLRCGYSACQGYRQNMEDAHYVTFDLPLFGLGSGFFAVFDGHGSPAAAKFCAHNMSGQIEVEFAGLNPMASDFDFRAKDALINSFVLLDNALRDADGGGDKSPGSESGCTVACALISEEKIYIAHLGDSRVFLSRGGAVAFQTQDHKPTNEGEKKRIEAAGGFVNKGRVCRMLAVSRALGDHALKDPAVAPDLQMISPIPEVNIIPRNHAADEFLFLGCDGIFEKMSTSKVCQFVRDTLIHHEAISDVCGALIDKCLEYHATDNMTAMLVCFPGSQNMNEVGDIIDSYFDNIAEGADAEKEKEKSSSRRSSFGFLKSLSGGSHGSPNKRGSDGSNSSQQTNPSPSKPIPKSLDIFGPPPPPSSSSSPQRPQTQVQADHQTIQKVEVRQGHVAHMENDSEA